MLLPPLLAGHTPSRPPQSSIRNRRIGPARTGAVTAVPGTVEGMLSLSSGARSAASRAAAGYEAARWAPHNVAGALIGWRSDRAAARCAADPRWVAIEERRQRPDGLITFLSDDLTWDDHRVQAELEDALAPRPAWLPLAYAVRHRPLRRARYALRDIAQRARRGWSDSDVYSLGDHLTAQLADQLTALAATAHGWPAGDRYPAPEDWTAALRSAAAGLRGWADREQAPEVDAHLATLSGPATEETRDAARDAEDADARVRLAGAQDALRWVADNLPHLWD